MMKICYCAGCIDWAQYRIKYPDGVIRLLCKRHKEDLEHEGITGLKISFVGAVPRGINDSELR
jgi:hypothetical protein